MLVYSVVLNWGAWIPGTWWLLRALPGGKALLPVWIWMMLYVLVFAGGFWLRFRRGRWRLRQRARANTSVLGTSLMGA